VANTAATFLRRAKATHTSLKVIGTPLVAVSCDSQLHPHWETDAQSPKRVVRIPTEDSSSRLCSAVNSSKVV
jgi:hypothetical protein